MPASPGLLNEQGSECNNRWWRQFREFNARKTSIGTSLRDPFVRKMEIADPEILAINASYINGGKRRRIRKRAAKAPLPEGVVALLTDQAQEKYLASANPIEMEESSSPEVPTPSDPQPGPSGTQPDSPPASESDRSDSDGSSDEEDLDNLVFVSYSSDDEDWAPEMKRQAEDMEVEEPNSSLGYSGLKSKKKCNLGKPHYSTLTSNIIFGSKNIFTE